MSTHAKAAFRTGPDQQRVLPRRVSISRGRSSVTVAMYRFGISGSSFDQPVDIVLRMCERGHADRMVLSHDYAAFIDHLCEQFYLDSAGWDYLVVCSKVIAALRERAVSEQQVHLMLVDNPRRIFEANSAG